MDLFRLDFHGDQRLGVFFFHGFPSIVSRKNDDFARGLHDHNGLSTHVIHYPGLGKSPGNFYFDKTLDICRDWIHGVQQERNYEKIAFVGHSFGGLVSLCLLKDFRPQLSHMVLLSPLTYIGSSREFRLTYKRRFSTSGIKKILEHTNEDDVFQQWEELRKVLGESEKSFSALKEMKTMIFHSNEDKTIPIEATQGFVEKHGVKESFESFNTDHRFLENREVVYFRLRKFFTL